MANNGIASENDLAWKQYWADLPQPELDSYAGGSSTIKTIQENDTGWDVEVEHKKGDGGNPGALTGIPGLSTNEELTLPWFQERFTQDTPETKDHWQKERIKEESERRREEKKAANAKGYQCKPCFIHKGVDLTFATTRGLKEHDRIIHGPKPFPCKFPRCGRFFADKFLRAEHVRAEHRPKNGSRLGEDFLRRLETGEMVLTPENTPFMVCVTVKKKNPEADNAADISADDIKANGIETIAGASAESPLTIE